MRHYWNISMLDRKAKWIHTVESIRNTEEHLWGKIQRIRWLEPHLGELKEEIPKCLENKLFLSWSTLTSKCGWENPQSFSRILERQKQCFLINKSQNQISTTEVTKVQPIYDCRLSRRTRRESSYIILGTNLQEIRNSNSLITAVLRRKIHLVCEILWRSSSLKKCCSNLIAMLEYN